MPERISRLILWFALAASALVILFWSLVSGHRRPFTPRQPAAEPDPLPVACLAMPAPAELVPLRFGWPAEGRVRVRAEHRRDGTSVREEFELYWRPLEGVGSIVEVFPWPWHAESVPPGPTRTSGSLLTPVQAVIAQDGRFVCTPRLDDLRHVWGLSAGHRADAPAPEPLAERWPDWVERWIGVALWPGESRHVPCDNPSARTWIHCESLDVERTRLQYRTLRPRVAAETPGGDLDSPIPAAEEIGCELESVVEAELLLDGLRPLDVRSRSRWRWARNTTDVVRVVEHESRYVFDWSASSADPSGVRSGELPAAMQSWAASLWPELSEGERELETDEWRAIWPLLPAPRRDQVLAATNAAAADLGMRWPLCWSWQAVRPALHRLWRLEDPLPSRTVLRTWVENGPPESSVDVLFVGEGYTAAELGPTGKYWIDVCVVSHWLFEEAPFSWYRDWFNVRALFLESLESGCDPGYEVDEVDTALDACLDEESPGLWIRNRRRLQELLRGSGDEADIVFVMVNSDRCAGVGDALDDPLARGGRRAVPVFTIGCRRAQTAAHEMGHTFAGLADEYEDPELAQQRAVEDVRAPNLTLAREPAGAAWEHFLALPGAERFTWHHEGGGYHSKEVFRPWLRCRMRDSGESFCPVCCEAVSRAIFETCGLAWDDAEYHRARPVELWSR